MPTIPFLLCKMKKRVLVGMSGGVDSSVAAMLLKKQGYDVTGMTMRLRKAQGADGSHGAEDDINDARRVCETLGIEHIVLDLTEEFARRVMDNFAEEYKNGRTPNPCIVCNKYLKFGAALEKALELGYDYVATGHYVQRREENGKALLYRSPTGKDQSYMLWSLTPFQVEHSLFPLADLDKPAIRQLAEEAGLPVAQKPDSQDICFVEDGDYVGFLARYAGITDAPGDFLDADGTVIGRHNGIFHYTIGQRKGLGAFGAPRYVTGIDAARNAVTLGPEGSQYRQELVAEDVNFIPFDSLHEPMRVQAAVRYRARPAEATLFPLEDGCVHVVFDTPQRSVTPGQSVVFYSGDLLVGGGMIR